MSALPVQNAPVAAPEETMEQQVQRLLATWRAAVAYLSSSTARVAHPAYRELIALGLAALPALFRDLEQTLDKIDSILKAERLKRTRQEGLGKFIATL